MTEWQDWLGIYTFYSFYLLPEYVNFSLFAYHYGQSFQSLHRFTQPQPLFSFWCSNRLSFGQWKHFLGWLLSPLDMTHWSLKNVLVFWHIKIFQSHLSAPRMESDFSPNDPLFLLVWKNMHMGNSNLNPVLWNVASGPFQWTNQEKIHFSSC